MSNRTYRLFMGALLLIFLYFDQVVGIYALLVVMFLEGITNFLVPDVINSLRLTESSPVNNENLAPFKNKSRFHFSAERAWRLVVAVMLSLTYIFFNENYTFLSYQLIENFSYINWFLPWFMGFTIFGAGISGICPVLIAIKWVGFK